MSLTTPSSGYRDDLGATIHDIDEKDHRVAVDFPIAVDSYSSDFGPGAFEEGWRRQLPVMCENHRHDRVIGRAVRAESLPDAHRIVGRFANFAEVPAARAAFSCIRDGIYPGFSFHYVDGRAVPHPRVRSAIRYTSARMIEYGPVLAPSIPGTRVVGLRSAQDVRSDLLGHLDDLRARCYDLETVAEERRAEDYVELERLFARHDSRRVPVPTPLRPAFDSERRPNVVHPVEYRILAAAAEKREALLDAHLEAVARGSESTARREVYRPLSDAVMARILRTMMYLHPRPHDPKPDPLASWSPSARQALDRTLSQARAAFERAPRGEARRGDRPVEVGRPALVVIGGLRPRPGDPSTVCFHPSTGEPCPDYWPDAPDPCLRPHPLELPGCLWPDGGEGETFPAERALEDLRRVRWAPGRPTLFLVALGAPEPE